MKAKVKINTEHVRAAIQTAVALGYKLPNLDTEEFIASYVTSITFEAEEVHFK